MNGKKAKRLRREAELMTIGMPSIVMVQGTPPTFTQIRNKVTLAFGAFKKVRLGKPQTLNIGCTRFVYKKLKIHTKA